MIIVRRMLCGLCLFPFGLVEAIPVGNPPTADEVNRVFAEFQSAFVAVEVTPHASFYFARPSDEAIAKFKSLEVENWRILLSDIDRLPSSPQNPLKAITAGQIASDCEVLPPFEYLDLLDRVLDLIEAGKLPAGFAENCFSGEFQKDHFIAVNYKHPRVKKLIERAKKVCAEDADVMVFLNACSKGEYADNYDPSKALAKMLPRDPKFDPRPARRDGAAPESPAQKQTGLSKGWVWFTVATILFAIAFAIWKFRSRTTVRSR